MTEDGIDDWMYGWFDFMVRLMDYHNAACSMNALTDWQTGILAGQMLSWEEKQVQ